MKGYAAGAEGFRFHDWKPERVHLAYTGVYGHGFNDIDLRATKVWRYGSSMDIAYLKSANVTASSLFADGINILADHECHGSSLHFVGMIHRTYLLINDVLSKRWNARSSPTPNYTRMCGSCIWRYNRITISDLINFLFAGQCFKRLRLFGRDSQVWRKKIIFQSRAEARLLKPLNDLRLLWLSGLTNECLVAGVCE